MAALPPGVDLCSIPAGVPPDGVVPNFVDPVDASVETLVAGSVLTAISTIFVLGRLYVNRTHMKLADYLTILAFVLSTAYSGLVMAVHGYSRHSWDMPACWYIEDYIWKMLFTQNVFLGPTQFVTKAGILVLYFQLFAVSKKMRWVIMAGIIFLGLLYLPHPILVGLYNAPRPGERWADLATNGMPQKISYYAPIHGVGSIVVDTYIFIIPLLVLSKLHISKQKRISLIAVFTIASLAIISSIFSCYWRITILVSNNGDFTWQEAQLFIWIMVEHNTALVVGCMPSFSVFLKNHVGKSTFIGTIRSRVFGTRNGVTGVSKPSLPSENSGAKNSKRRARSDYYELDESMLNTQANITTQANYEFAPQSPGDKDRVIFKTTGFTQESHPHSMV
ncbi:hypothetical protein GGS23DRAFT_345533 [Durotheca rogersii]|uniref:uncharacterized protein n=1 Tax=Durotheca rogersii TaxID=419775 RepID=UPI002220455B|nr:uncharacterized protein GGS23DRAFT_345533 [Durotheca rogersii]KAI5857354.1 hypothetical protein GGS23DRAFT_345533 [Durotheca rogersii]